MRWRDPEHLDATTAQRTRLLATIRTASETNTEGGEWLPAPAILTWISTAFSHPFFLGPTDLALSLANGAATAFTSRRELNASAAPDAASVAEAARNCDVIFGCATLGTTSANRIIACFSQLTADHGRVCLLMLACSSKERLDAWIKDTPNARRLLQIPYGAMPMFTAQSLARGHKVLRGRGHSRRVVALIGLLSMRSGQRKRSRATVGVKLSEHLLVTNADLGTLNLILVNEIEGGGTGIRWRQDTAPPVRAAARRFGPMQHVKQWEHVRNGHSRFTATMETLCATPQMTLLMNGHTTLELRDELAVYTGLGLDSPHLITVAVDVLIAVVSSFAYGTCTTYGRLLEEEFKATRISADPLGAAATGCIFPYADHLNLGAARQKTTVAVGSCPGSVFVQHPKTGEFDLPSRYANSPPCLEDPDPDEACAVCGCCVNCRPIQHIGCRGGGFIAAREALREKERASAISGAVAAAAAVQGGGEQAFVLLPPKPVKLRCAYITTDPVEIANGGFRVVGRGPPAGHWRCSKYEVEGGHGCCARHSAQLEDGPGAEASQGGQRVIRCRGTPGIPGLGCYRPVSECICYTPGRHAGGADGGGLAALTTLSSCQAASQCTRCKRDEAITVRLSPSLSALGANIAQIRRDDDDAVTYCRCAAIVEQAVYIAQRYHWNSTMVPYLTMTDQLLQHGRGYGYLSPQRVQRDIVRRAMTSVLPHDPYGQLLIDAAMSDEGGFERYSFETRPGLKAQNAAQPVARRRSAVAVGRLVKANWEALDINEKEPFRIQSALKYLKSIQTAAPQKQHGFPSPTAAEASKSRKHRFERNQAKQRSDAERHETTDLYAGIPSLQRERVLEWTTGGIQGQLGLNDSGVFFVLAYQARDEDGDESNPGFLVQWIKPSRVDFTRIDQEAGLTAVALYVRRNDAAGEGAAAELSPGEHLRVHNLRLRMRGIVDETAVAKEARLSAAEHRQKRRAAVSAAGSPAAAASELGGSSSEEDTDESEDEHVEAAVSAEHRLPLAAAAAAAAAGRQRLKRRDAAPVAGGAHRPLLALLRKRREAGGPSEADLKSIAELEVFLGEEATTTYPGGRLELKHGDGALLNDESDEISLLGATTTGEGGAATTTWRAHTEIRPRGSVPVPFAVAQLGRSKWLAAFTSKAPKARADELRTNLAKLKQSVAGYLGGRHEASSALPTTWEELQAALARAEAARSERTPARKKQRPSRPQSRPPGWHPPASGSTDRIWTHSVEKRVQRNRRKNEKGRAKRRLALSRGGGAGRGPLE